MQNDLAGAGPLDSPSARRPDWTFGAIACVVYAAVLAPRLAVHVFWRDEWQSWLLASDGCDLRSLFHRVGYEGHPSLWYLLLWLGSHASRSPVVMQVIHGLLASAAIYVLATFAPWPRLLRGLACAGYFLVFEYAVVSRNYAAGALALFAFAAFQTWRSTAMWPAALMIAIAAQANVLAAMLGAFLAIWIGVQWWLDGRPMPRRFAVAVSIVTLGFLLAFLQLRGPADRSYTPTTFDVSPMRAAKMAAAIYRSFIPIPSVTRAWWATNVLDFSPKTNPLNVVQSLLGVVTFGIAFWLLPARRGVRWLWVGGAVVLLAFGYFKFTGSLRHHGHFFLLFLLALWLGADAARGRATLDARRRRVLLALFALQALAGVITSVLDLLMPFSASRDAGEFIASRYPNAAVIAQVDFSVSPIAGVLNAPLYYPVPGRWGTFIVWNNRRNVSASSKDLARCADALRRTAPGRPILLAISDDAKEQPSGPTFAKVARFDDSSIESERYTIYEVAPRGASTTQPSP